MKTLLVLWLSVALLLVAAPAQAADAGWRGEYYGNRWLAGGTAVLRTDATINFNWGAGAPARGIPADGFSARWTRTMSFAGGRYRFTTETDDGVRLYVDGRLILDRWRDQSASRHVALVDLPAGNHAVVMEYYENGGLAVAKLWWKLEPRAVGNIISCVRPADSWLKIYRLEDSGWLDLNPHGWGPIDASGRLKIDGLPVDTARYPAGHPYRVELWANGLLIRSVGNTSAGEALFKVYPWTDNTTPWGCPAP